MIFLENEFLKTCRQLDNLWEQTALAIKTDVEINGKSYSFETPFMDKFTLYSKLAGRRVSGIYIMRRIATETEPKSKYYVGKSVDLLHRIKTHFLAPERDSALLHKVIKKHPDLFEAAIIEYAEPSELNAAEEYWINELNTLDRDIGYNLKAGGEGGASKYIVTAEMHREIIKELSRNELTEAEIANKFGLASAKTIYTINQGCHWLSSSEYNYPIRDADTISSIAQQSTRLKDPRTPWLNLYRLHDSKTINPTQDELLGKYLGAGKAALAIYQIFRTENELSDISDTKILQSIQRCLNRRDRKWHEFYVIPAEST